MTIAEDLSFSINSSTSLFSAGFCALKLNTNGNHNVAIGQLAMCSNTTGCNNLALGCRALTFNVSGHSNVAIGYWSLTCNLAGCNNTAIGCYALHKNTTGHHNTAIGNNALYGNISGCNNFAVGNLALLCNVCSDNTAIGFCALRCNTTGSNNFAVGNSALFSNGSGSNNVAIGFASSYLNTLGNCNVAIGMCALCGGSTPCNNVAIGANSLRSNSCRDNLGIGCNALSTNIYYDNVALGVNAMAAATFGYYGVALGTAALCNLSSYGSVGIGYKAGCSASGLRNVFVGYCSGAAWSTGCRNVLIGGNSGLGINGQCCHVVIADGGGTVRMNFTATGAVSFGTSLTDFGSAGQVLCSQGPTAPPVWATVSGGGGGASGAAAGSGLFNTSISNQVGYTLVGDAFTSTYATTGSGIIATMPSTTATRYVLHSLHITNVAASDAEVTGRFELTNGRGGFQLADTAINNVSWFASRLPVPSGSAVELLKKPQVLYPNDIIRLQSTSANGGGGVNGQLYAYLVFEGSTDYTYQSGNLNLASSSPTTVYNSVLSTGTTTSTAFPSIIESMRVTNYSNVADYRISVAWTNSIGVVQSYLAYNMLIPAFATVELLEKPKRLAAGDLIRATPEAPNVISMQVSGKIITSTFV